MDQLYRLCNFVGSLFSSQINDQVNDDQVIDNQVNDQVIDENNVRVVKLKKMKKNVIKRTKINFTRQKNFKPVKIHKNNY